MKEINIELLIKELQEAKEEGNDYVFFKGTIMTVDAYIIVSTEKQM